VEQNIFTCYNVRRA